MTLLDYQTPQNPRKSAIVKWLKIAALIVSMGIAGFVLRFLFGIAAFLWMMSPTTSVSAYPRIISEWGTSPAISHFPKTIPSEAMNAGVYSESGFGQGESILTLKYHTTPSDIETLIEKWQPLAIIPDGSETYLTRHPLPPSFKVFFLTANRGNHGINRGVAIDVSAENVFFWTEVW